MPDRPDADPPGKTPAVPDKAVNEAVERLLLDYLDALDAGKAPGLEEFMAGQRPEVQEELRHRVEPLLRVRKAMRAASSSEGPAPSEPTLEGTTLGDFELLREVGHGGMGIVLLARQKSLKRLVAVKVLNSTVAATTRGVTRFQHETTSAGRLSHPNIVQLLEAGTDRGLRFFAMEWMAGGTLYQRIERRRRERAEAARRADTPAVRSAIEQSLRAMLQIAEALAYIHEHGVIHRDVKPQNILFDDKGVAHLADFGLAKDEEASSLSRTGDIAGTPHYLSPEQALAKRITIDHRTDIYSLGVVLYESLSLVKPFDGKTLEQVLFAISFREPKGLRKIDPRIPRDVETVCHKAIEKNPNRRYATARKFADDLRHLLDHEAIDARPPTPVSRIVRAARRHKVACLVAGATVAAAAAGWWTQQYRGQREQARAAYDQLFGKAVEPLKERTTTELAEIRQSLQQAKGLETSLDEPDRARVSALSTSFDQEIRARRDRAIGHLKRGLGGRAAARGAPYSTIAASVQSDVDYFLGLSGVFAVAPFLPDDAELQRYAVLESTFPKLTITAADGSSGAEVFLRSIEPYTGRLGERRRLGQLPLTDFPISPGYSRVVVERDDGTFAEMTRLFVDRGSPYVLTAWFRGPEELASGMAPIAGGRFRLGKPKTSEGQDLAFGEREFDVADFSIDLMEVSNAEYRRYMDDLARRSPPIPVNRPEYWPPEPWDPSWDRLPVTGISVEEAMRFAEWAGKRLPTAMEWERAARGPRSFLFPWGNENAQLVKSIGNVERYPMCENKTDVMIRDFKAHVQPVGECDQGAIGPEGLLHTLGNVSEWTESPALYVIDGKPCVLPYQWQAKGFDFYAIWPSAEKDGLSTQLQMPQPAGNSTIGIRCAKSKTP